MKILLVHQNFPGQFRGLAPKLRAAGHELRALSMRPEASMVGVPNRAHRAQRASAKDIHPWLSNTESAVIRGQSAAEEAERMAAEGWSPDLVFGHTGWGEMLFMGQALPRARTLCFHELYYRSEDGDVGFDPEFPVGPDAAKRLQVRNFQLAASVLACDQGVTPTEWQAGSFPPLLRQRIEAVHDGIDTAQLKPNPDAWVRLGRDGLVLRQGDEVLTFVNRNLEPMRGYHQFMRALPAILANRPKARVVIVGGDEVSYGAVPVGQKGYKDMFLNEVRDRLDMSRVHFVSRVPYSTLLALLCISSAHVYLTAPFVLSWSMLEAMSLGALVVGSDTAPVREVIAHGQNGLLVDFFSPQQLAETVCEVLAEPARYAHLRLAARQSMVEAYDFERVCWPRYQRLIEGS